jgi:hypothetical protein
MIAKILAFVLVFAMTVPVATSIAEPTVASAASVALTTTKKTVVMGSSYTVTLKDSNLVAKKSFKSSNIKIATVNGKGIVTPVKAGSVKIACTVTLTSGVTVKLICNITVKDRVPATGLTLNAVYDKNNTHNIKVAEKYDFNAKLIPTTSNDTVFYSIADTDIATVNSYGVVTGIKEGFTVLEARAGINKTEAFKTTNKAVTRVYIQITPKDVPTPTPTPTPTVAPKATGVSMVSSKEIQIQFNTTIEKSSVINSNNELVAGAVAVIPGAGATAIGTLSATLSQDKKALNLITSGEFNGTYVVSVFSKIMATDGQLVAAGAFQSDFKDTVGPAYVSTQVDDTGYICKINFNEALDISGLAILSVNGTSSTTVKSFLSNPSNYVLSSDKKTLSISLGSLNEKALNVMVSMVGIKDVKGNASVQYQLNTLVQTDATPKPLANIVEVKRESKTLLVATFDRGIQFGGYAIIDGNYITGVIDSTDNKKVKYTLTNTAITGSKNVTFSGWINYNVSNATGNSQTRAVDFTLDTTAPKVVGYEFAVSTENGSSVQTLTLVYDKKISLVNGSGTLSALVNSNSGNVYTKSITYTAVANAQKLTLTFAGQNFDSGYYKITLPAGMVVDSLENLSATQDITVAKQAGSSVVLPQPVSILQDPTNPSKIKVTFANKLDQVSAQTVANYLVNGTITPVSATIIEQSDSNAVVELVFASASFSSSGTYTIKVSGVKGYNDSYGPMKEYNTILTLVDNSGPQVVSCKLTSATAVQLTLSKNVTGTGEFQIHIGGTLVNATATYVAGNVIYITLPSPVTASTYLVVTKNELKDANNNLANIQSPLLAEKSY